VIENILDFDPRMMTPAIRKEVEALIKEKGNSFESQVIYRASAAAGPLADWVKAVLKYSEVVERIRPMENKLASFNDALKG